MYRMMLFEFKKYSEWIIGAGSKLSNALTLPLVRLHAASVISLLIQYDEWRCITYNGKCYYYYSHFLERVGWDDTSTFLSLSSLSRKSEILHSPTYDAHRSTDWRQVSEMMSKWTLNDGIVRSYDDVVDDFRFLTTRSTCGGTGSMSLLLWNVSLEYDSNVTQNY